jgi:AMIN domain-containing protein
VVLFFYPLVTSGEVLPRRRPQPVINSLLLALVLCGLAGGQNPSQEAVPSETLAADEVAQPSAAPALNDVRMVVQRIEVQREGEGSTVEITSSGALIPNITKLEGPPRLVIDLPESVAAAPRGVIPVQAADIKSIQLTQQQNNPPITRIVVNLNESRSYFWETVENKLLVHVRPPEPAATDSDPANSEVAFTKGADPIVSSGSGGTGVVVPAGNFTTGSAVTAGAETTVLNLARGGQVRVCPGTTISVNGSQGGRDVMLAMSTGALETHYDHGSPGDSILTPDFRIVLPEAGAYHYAVSADLKGNTCVRALSGNSGSAIVSELLGDGRYQVKPGEQVVFRAGQLSKMDSDIPLDCGCPSQQVPVLRAEAPIAAPEAAPASEEPAAASQPAPAEAAKDAQSAALMAALPPEQNLPAEVIVSVTPRHRSLSPGTRNVPVQKNIPVQVDAPLVFRATPPPPPPAPTEEAALLPVVSGTRKEPMKLVVQPPPAAAQKRDAKPGVFGHIKNFFKGLFS